MLILVGFMVSVILLFLKLFGLVVCTWLVVSLPLFIGMIITILIIAYIYMVLLS